MSFLSPPPPSWFSGPRSRCPEPFSATFSWRPDAAQLEKLYAGKNVLSPLVYCNGFWLGLKLNHPKHDGSVTQLELLPRLQTAKWPSSLRSLWEQQGCLAFSWDARIGKTGMQTHLSPRPDVFDRSMSFGAPEALRSSTAADVKELLALHLQEDYSVTRIWVWRVKEGEEREEREERSAVTFAFWRVDQVRKKLWPGSLLRQRA